MLSYYPTTSVLIHAACGRDTGFWCQRHLQVDLDRVAMPSQRRPLDRVAPKGAILVLESTLATSTPCNPTTALLERSAATSRSGSSMQEKAFARCDGLAPQSMRQTHLQQRLLKGRQPPSLARIPRSFIQRKRQRKFQQRHLKPHGLIRLKICNVTRSSKATLAKTNMPLWAFLLRG